jgi:uncharacterized membrane protein
MHRRTTIKRWVAGAPFVLLAVVLGCSSDDTDREEVAETEEGVEEEEGGVATQSICPPDSDLDYVTFGREFMIDYCTSCHSSDLTGVARNGAPEGYDFDTLEGILAEMAEIDEWAAAGPAAINTAMPPSAPIPTEDERRQLGEWLACEMGS